MTVGDEDPHLIPANQLRGNLARNVGCPTESHVESALDELAALLRHAGLDSMNLQLRMLCLDESQYLRQRVAGRIAEGHTQHRHTMCGSLSSSCCASKTVKDLSDIGEK
jgi:hypothetical protein